VGVKCVFHFYRKLPSKTLIVLIHIQHVLLAMRARTEAGFVNSVIDVRL
jgi:hypothetical protein